MPERGDGGQKERTELKEREGTRVVGKEGELEKEGALHGEMESRQREAHEEFRGGGGMDQQLTGEAETVGRGEVEGACDGEN